MSTPNNQAPLGLDAIPEPFALEGTGALDAPAMTVVAPTAAAPPAVDKFPDPFAIESGSWADAAMSATSVEAAISPTPPAPPKEEKPKRSRTAKPKAGATDSGRQKVVPPTGAPARSKVQPTVTPATPTVMPTKAVTNPVEEEAAGEVAADVVVTFTMPVATTDKAFALRFRATDDRYSPPLINDSVIWFPMAVAIVTELPDGRFQAVIEGRFARAKGIDKPWRVCQS